MQSRNSLASSGCGRLQVAAIPGKHDRVYGGVLGGIVQTLFDGQAHRVPKRINRRIADDDQRHFPNFLDCVRQSVAMSAGK